MHFVMVDSRNLVSPTRLYYINATSKTLSDTHNQEQSISPHTKMYTQKLFVDDFSKNTRDCVYAFITRSSLCVLCPRKACASIAFNILWRIEFMLNIIRKFFAELPFSFFNRPNRPKNQRIVKKNGKDPLKQLFLIVVSHP